MNKQFVLSHPRFFRACISVYNHIKPKNKLRAKGCTLSVGLSVINGLKIVSHGTGNEIIIGDFVRINNSTITIYGSNNKIILGDRSLLNGVELYMEDCENEISIGKNTKLCGKAHLATIEGTKILIGENCLFASDLHFRTGDSHSILDPDGKRINPSQDIVIDDHVWIGTKVTCLKGVHVAHDCVAAATATLCKNYDTPNAIIGGVPGRVIKTDIRWSDERI